jgi:hypothetical protein
MTRSSARNARSRSIATAISVAIAATGIACQKSSAGADPSASASASGSSSLAAAAGGIPIAASVILDTNNPGHLPVFNGNYGVVEGTVKVKGDPPLDSHAALPPGNAECADARALYIKQFRVSPDGALADAVVGITDFDAYVPPRGDVRTVRIHGCAFDSRTITLTFGQRIEVVNTDREAYLPHLNGARNPALMVAMPGGDPIRMYPPQPGRYLLTDDIRHPWMRADVYVFKYATHATTAVDGRYRIENVPEGRVKVSVYHPAIGRTMERYVEVRPNETLKNIDFEIEYEVPRAAPSGSNGVRPPDLRLPRLAWCRLTRRCGSFTPRTCTSTAPCAVSPRTRGRPSTRCAGRPVGPSRTSSRCASTRRPSCCCWPVTSSTVTGATTRPASSSRPR